LASSNPLARPVDWQWSGVPSNGSWQMAPTLRTCVLVRGERPGILDLGARRECHAFLEAEINADLGTLAERLRFVFGHKIAIPKPARVFQDVTFNKLSTAFTPCRITWLS
jgi:hypothetical protein